MKIEQSTNQYSNQFRLENIKTSQTPQDNTLLQKTDGDSIDLSQEFFNKALEYQSTQESPLGDTPPIEPDDPDDPSAG